MATRPSSAQRARRLLALLPHLRERGSLPLAELARRTGTDVGTLAQDLVTLSLCGADQTDANAMVSVLVDGDHAVVFGDLPALDAPVRLTAAEAASLLAALESCGTGPDDELPRKLTSVATGRLDPAELAETVRIAASPGGPVDASVRLAAAAAGRRMTRIAYTAQGALESVVRTVRPWSLFSSRGVWYLRAWDESREAERTFRLDRISSVEVTGTTFEAPDHMPPPDAVPDAASLPRAEVLFAHDAPDLNDRGWPGATFERLADGRVRASVPYAGIAWIARKVAARLGEAVVLGPAEVRAAVARLAQQERERL